jgi:hypothetical protein
MLLGTITDANSMKPILLLRFEVKHPMAEGETKNVRFKAKIVKIR